MPRSRNPNSPLTTETLSVAERLAVVAALETASDNWRDAADQMLRMADNPTPDAPFRPTVARMFAVELASRADTAEALMKKLQGASAVRAFFTKPKDPAAAEVEAAVAATEREGVPSGPLATGDAVRGHLAARAAAAAAAD